MLLLIYSDNTQVLIKLLVLINLSYIKKKEKYRCTYDYLERFGESFKKYTVRTFYTL